MSSCTGREDRLKFMSHVSGRVIRHKEVNTGIETLNISLGSDALTENMQNELHHRNTFKIIF